MLGSCDETSNLLDRIEHIDEEEKRPLTLKDIPSCPSSLDPAQTADELEQEWAREQQLAAADDRPPSLRRVLWRIYKTEFLLSILCRVGYEGFTIASPFVLRELVRWMEQDFTGSPTQSDLGLGYGLAIAFSLCTLLLLLALARATDFAYQGLMKLSTSIMVLLQRKLQRLPPAQMHVGTITTLIGTESQSILLGFWLSSVFSNPPALVGNVVALYFFIGWPGLLGAAVLALFAIVQAVFTKSSVGARSVFLNAAEIRVRRVAQVLSNVKMVKIFGWEPQVLRLVRKLREVEIGEDALSGLIRFRTVIIGMSHATPQLCQLAVFGSVFGVFGHQTAESLFPVITLLNSARITTASFSMNLNRFADLLLSVERWQEFLLLPERNSYVSVAADDSSDSAAASSKGGGSLAVKVQDGLQFGVVTSPSIYRETQESAKEEKNENKGENTPPKVNSVVNLPPGAQPLNDGTNSFWAPILEPVQLGQGGLKRNSLNIISGRVAAGKTVLLASLIGIGDLPPSSLASFGSRQQKQQQQLEEKNSGNNNETEMQIAESEEEAAPFSPVVHNSQQVIVCPADSWIVSGTLRENITLQNLSAGLAESPETSHSGDIDTDKYAMALWASGLHVDLASLPAGDLTTIGASGLNLSGGQKARTQIARAIYTARPSALIFLDDVLAAVDPALVRSLFDTAICGALAGTTRVLISHQRELFQQADRIIEMADRRIVFDGAPGELEEFNRKRQRQQKQQQQQQEQQSDDAEEVEGETASKTAAAASSATVLPSPPTSPSTSSPSAVAASAAFVREEEFFEHVKKAFAADAAVDGKKKKEKPATVEGGEGEQQQQQKQQQEDDEFVDASAGLLFRKETQLVGRTRWRVFLFYSRKGGLCISVLILFFFICWRTAYMLNDLVLAAWTDNNILRAGSSLSPAAASANSTTNATANSTTPSPSKSQVVDWSNDEMMIAFAVVIVISLLAIYFRTILFVRWVFSASAGLHDELFTKVLRAPMSWHDTTKSSEPLARLSKDMEMTDGQFPEEFYFSFSIIVNTLFFAISIVVAGGPYMLIFIVPLFLFYEKSRRKFSTGLRAVRRLEHTVRAPCLSTLLENITGLKAGIVQSARLQQAFLQRFMLACTDLAATYDAFRQIQRWVLERLAIVGFGLCVFMCLAGVTCRVVPELQSAVVSISFLNLGMAMSAALALNICYSASTLSNVLTIFSSVERIHDYCHCVPHETDCGYNSSSSNGSTEPIPSGADDTVATVVKVGEASEDSQQHSRRLVPAPPANFPANGSLEFSNVSMRYRPGLPLVLKGVSFRAESGQRIGCVGRSGDGKSSIITSLYRLAEIEPSGSIKLAGRDIRDIKLQQLRGSVLSTIPQDASSALFAGTVRTNLSPWDDDAGQEDGQDTSSSSPPPTNEDLVRALEMVGLKDRFFSPSSSNGDENGTEGEGAGLESSVESGGANLSSGERQLLVLARALLRRARYLILDEATANTDDSTDAAIQRVLEQQFDGVTFFVIAHRIATLIHCDKILVMQRGVAAEFDSPANLLRNSNSVFHAMCENLGAVKLGDLKRLALEYERQRLNLE